LVGQRFDHPGEALALMDRATVNNSFTKSAIDTALWDLWAKQQSLPVWKLFADREPERSIPIRASIGAYQLEHTVALAKGFWNDGVRTLKFKVGLPDGQDVQRLRAVRDELGGEPVFTVDYNGAFEEASQAIHHIESLLPFNLALVEQPTHRDRIALMAQVRRRIPIPVLADEAIFTPQHLAEAIDLDAFDILSIYPGKNGGFSHSLDMARQAARAGKTCVIGSNLETDIGQAAMATLAAGSSAFPVQQLPCDLLSALYYQRSSISRPLKLCKGQFTLPDGIGFGIHPLDDMWTSP
jgi:muconate cycloisomerase